MELKKKTGIVLKKINRHGRENIAAVILLNLFLVIGFCAVLWLLRSYSIDFCLRTLEQKAQEAQRDIDLRFSAIEDYLEMLADIIAAEEDLTSDHVTKILQLSTQDHMISNLGVILADGRILDQEGNLSDVPTDEDPLNGNYQLEGLEEDSLFVFFNVPIKKNGKEEGALYGLIEPQDLSRYFKVDIFDGNANVFIIDPKNMAYVMDTAHDRMKDIHALENFPIKKGYSEEEVIKDFAEGVGGRTAYFSRSKNEYFYTAYEPLGFYDWFVLVTVPENTVFEGTEYIGKVLLGLGIYETFILLAYLLWNVIHTRREVRAKEKMATTDLLTNLKNRNAYEHTISLYEENLPAGLCCVYADANGLHELNNSQGHAAGDKMLQTVASAFVELFGQEHVYRIGGDEFLVFTEIDPEHTSKKAMEAKGKASESGYHVSVGTASAKEQHDVDALIKLAEQRMYEDKKQYYMTVGDRRERRS